MRPIDRRRGFTLVEILIVISIIALLVSIVLGAVTVARKRAATAVAKTAISDMKNQLEAYVRDTGKYPGTEYKDGENAFPALFAALFEDKPPKGRGGPSAPYMKFKEDDVLIWDKNDERFRKADVDEIYDPKLDKYLSDPWGEPYIYHENKSRARKSYMHDSHADVYSKGPDRVDQTGDGEKSDNDDVGSW